MYCFDCSRDPDWIDVKLAQAKYLLSRLSQFREHVSSKFSCIPPVIVAGDFNSTPGDEVWFTLPFHFSPIFHRSCLSQNKTEKEKIKHGFHDITTPSSLASVFFYDGSQLKPNHQALYFVCVFFL